MFYIFHEMILQKHIIRERVFLWVIERKRYIHFHTRRFVAYLSREVSSIKFTIAKLKLINNCCCQTAWSQF